MNYLKFGGHQQLNNVSGTAEAIVVKFCTQAGHVKSQYINDKRSLKGRDQGHVTNFKFFGPNDISGTAEARIVKLCTQVECNKC